MSAYGIDKWRYDELKARCRQYPGKRLEADTLLCVSSPSMSGMPHSGAISDPTSRAAEKRSKLLAWCEPIEYAASRAGGGAWYEALIRNCCRGVGYENLPPDVLPNSNRNEYFQARREFFWLLDKKLNFDTPGAVEM